jgi:hypothetical protein
MAVSSKNWREYITEEHRELMLHAFGTTDIDEIDRRNTETINYSDNKLIPYICGDYGEENSELADDVEMFIHARYAVK